MKINCQDFIDQAFRDGVWHHNEMEIEVYETSHPVEERPCVEYPPPNLKEKCPQHRETTGTNTG